MKQKPADKAKLFVKKQEADELCDSGPLQPMLPAKCLQSRNCQPFHPASIDGVSVEVFPNTRRLRWSECQIKFSSHTTILFDGVDTIFKQYDGFQGAVESVLAITKKPVVFRATRNLANMRAKLASGCPTAKFVHPSPDS